MRDQSEESEESEIVIVHNFNKLNTIEEVKNQIDIDIMNSFENIHVDYKKLEKTTTDEVLNENIGYVYFESKWN